MNKMIKPIILAGGGGTRLWPLSTSERPKHLLPLTGDRSLLEETVERVSDRGRFAPPLIICSAQQATAVEGLAGDASLLVEPEGRNSGPAIASAAASLAAETIMLVLPSDHLIADPRPLFDAVERGSRLAEKGWIVTFGIRPSRVETGYGYIRPGKALDEGASEAQRFVEKPDAEAAASLIREGCYWNAGLFLMEAATVLEEFREHEPEIEQAARAALPSGPSDRKRVELDQAEFRRAPSISFDHAVMERSRRVAVIPVDLDWSDLGSWASVYDIADKNGDGNVIEKGGIAIDSKGCLIQSEGPQVVAVGVSDLVIVATADHVLVVPRSEAQRVRDAAAIASATPKKPSR